MALKVPRQRRAFDRLTAVMRALRSRRGGCAWDKVQTHQSLRPYLIEEAYEVLEAIDSGDPAKLKGELGDLLLQVVFHAQIAAEKGAFDAEDVAAGIADKMVARHPHVFAGGAKVRSSGEQVKRWEALKAREKEHAARRSIVDGVPKAMPALYRARRVLGKAARARFAWAGKRQAWAKFDEELAEFRRALRRGSKKESFEELGDLLSALVNVARYEKLDPEAALHAGVAKLSRRIGHVEALARAEGKAITALKESELLRLWGEVKKREKGRRRR